MTSMSGVVQLAFMKSPAVSDDIKIYTDTIGLLVTTQLAIIKVADTNRFDDMFYQTSVPKRKVGSGQADIYILKSLSKKVVRRLHASI